MSFKAVRVCHHNAVVMLIKLCNFTSDFSKLNKGKVIFLLFVASQISQVKSGKSTVSRRSINTST